MAATPTPQETNPNDVGIFITNAAVGFVLATPEETAAILKQLKTGSVKDMTRQFINDLMTIKLLAPSESAGLLIQPVPMIKSFVSGLKQELLTAYYLQQREQ